jgi:hypothetical protein
VEPKEKERASVGWIDRKRALSGFPPSSYNVVLRFESRLCFRLQKKESTQCGGPINKTIISLPEEGSKTDFRNAVLH